MYKTVIIPLLSNIKESIMFNSKSFLFIFAIGLLFFGQLLLGMSNAAVEEDVASAVSFWEQRTSQVAAKKLAYWVEIQTALDTEVVSDELMEKVTASWSGAKVGGRMYTTWQGVYNRFVELLSPKPVIEEEVEQVEEPEFDFSALDIEIPDEQPDNAPPGLVTLASDQNTENNTVNRPDWFNPGGGYTSKTGMDGHYGYFEKQDGSISLNTQDTEEDYCDATSCTNRACNTCPNTRNPDGIPDWTYYSYEDAQVNADYPGRDFATLGWGPWDDLPQDVQTAVNGISLPTSTELAEALGTTHVQASYSYNRVGTATYEGDVKGVIRPDLFGTIYGTKDKPGTLENEYDDGGPRIRLVADFDAGQLDGELTARMTAQRLGFGPPVKQSLGIDEGHRWHSAHSHFFECPNSICAASYTAVRADSRNDGDGTYVHGRIETTVSPDAMLRTPVVRWNGIDLENLGTFEGQGLYGEFIATCTTSTHCTSFNNTLIDPAAAIAGYINHPRFVGSYLAPKEQPSN